MGVASASKENTIREFNHKHKYNEWQFVYDPTTDRGALLTTPSQPVLQLSNQPLQNGQTGNPNTNGSAFGQSTGFGNNQSGFNTGLGNNNSGDELEADQDGSRGFWADDLRSGIHEHGIVPQQHHLH